MNLPEAEHSTIPRNIAWQHAQTAVFQPKISGIDSLVRAQEFSRARSGGIGAVTHFFHKVTSYILSSPSAINTSHCPRRSAASSKGNADDQAIPPRQSSRRVAPHAPPGTHRAAWPP